MARPRLDSIEVQFEAQTQKWIRIADKAATIAQLQLDGFMEQVKAGQLSLDGHIQISTVIKDLLGAATKTIETGLKTIAARRDDSGSAEGTLSEAELLAEIQEKGN